MTTNESAITEAVDTNTAVQVDIEDVLPTPMDAVLATINDLKKTYRAVERHVAAQVAVRQEIIELRQEIADLALNGDNAELLDKTRLLNRTNNRLDRILENEHTAKDDLAGAIDAAKSALEELA